MSRGEVHQKETTFLINGFFKDMLMQGLGEIIDIYLYRVWADHYALYPIDVVLGIDGNRVFRVEIDITKLKDLIKSAYRILNYLEKY